MRPGTWRSPSSSGRSSQRSIRGSPSCPVCAAASACRRPCRLSAPARVFRSVVAEEVLDLRGGVLGTVARVEDQAANRDVLGGVEGDEPAVGLSLVLDVCGAGLSVNVRAEAEAGRRAAGDDGAHHLLEPLVGRGGQRGRGYLLG